ncbi:sulfotransferase 1 [Haematobia irritans]|uniref:sulfotransferase 1 n=1 Tax=Haematobia irritans TaxID=7368 RepID=UPI003F503E3B
MPQSTYRAVDIPFNQVQKLAISGGYSTFYPAVEPAVKIWGDYRLRYCSLADTFKPVLDRVYNFNVRDDDVYIITSTKCGTTWAQEMTWLIMNDFDFEQAKKIDLTIRSPFLEFNGVVPNVPHDTIDAANALGSPRLLKSHLPAMLIPKDVWVKKAKIIYVFRNPKDAAVSYFHHWRGMVGYEGSKENFVQSYIDGHVNFNPFWPHVLDFWQLRNSPQVFFTSYERMKKDLGGVIQDVCRFLSKAINEHQLAEMIDHLSFEKMRDNPACNHVREFDSMKEASGREVDDFRFVRRGIVGSHKDELAPNIIENLDEWTFDNLHSLNLSIEDFTTYSKY